MTLSLTLSTWGIVLSPYTKSTCGLILGSTNSLVVKLYSSCRSRFDKLKTVWSSWGDSASGTMMA